MASGIVFLKTRLKNKNICITGIARYSSIKCGEKPEIDLKISNKREFNS